jgi:glycosyltransferase involved in cell wall biosynthesis
MTRPLRLLQLVHTYPPALGGVQQSVSDVCERLVADYGWEVTVLATNALTSLSFRDSAISTLPIDPHGEQRNGVTVRRFSVDTRWAPFLRYAQATAYRLRLPGNGRLRTLWTGPISRGLLQATLTEKADVICAATFPFNHLSYPFRRPEPRPPVILVGAIHTENPWTYHRPDLFRLVKRAYSTIVHTEHERQWLINEQHVRPKQVRVIGHGIETPKPHPEPGTFRRAHRIPPEARVVAYIGAHSPHKGIETLIEVFPRLLESHDSMWLVVGGAETDYSADLRRLIAGLPEQARGRILFFTDISDSLKAEILVDADVFASPSREEAFGITTIEAWAYEKPVVVGDSPGQLDVVDDGRLGLVVPYGDTEQLLAALSRLSTDEALRMELGREGKRKVDTHYDLPEVIAQYHALFAEAAESSQSRRVNLTAEHEPKITTRNDLGDENAAEEDRYGARRHGRRRE